MQGSWANAHWIRKSSSLVSYPALEVFAKGGKSGKGDTSHILENVEATFNRNGLINPEDNSNPRPKNCSRMQKNKIKGTQTK